jgi:hypothetical protein
MINIDPRKAAPECEIKEVLWREFKGLKYIQYRDLKFLVWPGLIFLVKIKPDSNDKINQK